MYTFELSSKFLLNEEQAIFSKCLDYYHADKNIWDVFACLFASEVKGTKPLLIRVYENSYLCGAAITRLLPQLLKLIMRCSSYTEHRFGSIFFS